MNQTLVKWKEYFIAKCRYFFMYLKECAYTPCWSEFCSTFVHTRTHVFVAKFNSKIML